jgi:hypothetical protein
MRVVDSEHRSIVIGIVGDAGCRNCGQIGSAARTRGLADQGNHLSIINQGRVSLTGDFNEA